MRILLVVSIALIGLFADQSSLFATLVYQYDFTPSFAPGQTGTDYSGYIQMKERVGYADHMLGFDGLGLDSVFDFSITAGPSPATKGLPQIPAITYRPDDMVLSYSRGGFSSPDGSILNGMWRLLLGDFPASQTYITIDPGEGIRSFWPQAYVFNEGGQPGHWTFSGARNVPEAGSTLLYLALGMVILSSAGIKRLAWRNQ